MIPCGICVGSVELGGGGLKGRLMRHKEQGREKRGVGPVNPC